YQSPSKAIEELVVNSYDADAAECRVFVPSPGDPRRRFVVVYDDGEGMDYEGLVNLWHIGRSSKRPREVARHLKRKQIGKFGIGKLATYTIANQVTYVTRTDESILCVTLDFRHFATSATGANDAVALSVRRIGDWQSFARDGRFRHVCEAAQIDMEELFKEEPCSWTLALLEDLKPKAQSIRLGRLGWVLSTAMPLQEDFRLFLNGKEIASHKESYETIVTFCVGDLPRRRIEALQRSTGEHWWLQGEALFSDSFPSGVSGFVLVTQQALHAGKSADLGRSHGFFIRVRDRLINQDDAFFGMTPLSYQTFNRFRAELQVDDLDTVLTAPREGGEECELKSKLECLLAELFYEARDQYEGYLREIDSAELRKKEEKRNFVNPRLVEHSVADVLAAQRQIVRQGAEADEGWFYLELDPDMDLRPLIRTLYQQPRSRYRYIYVQQGAAGRLVSFNPSTSTFTLNADHQFVRAHADDGRAKVLLEDLVTAEALLEVYLREHHVPAHTVGEVLERRDALLRSLAQDHPFSLESISSALLDAAANEHDLEVALVTSARALGFVAKQISGDGEPDGIARFTDYPSGEKKITLEAKSSKSVPSLSSIDFAGLREHTQRHHADGCLLIAPSYPGSTRGEDSAAATRARDLRISCWTVEQLARVVAAAETRHLTARRVLDIVLNYFSPDQVSEAIERLFTDAAWDHRGLYRAILVAFQELEDRLPDSDRTVELIAGEVSRLPEFRRITKEAVREAMIELSAASQGGMTYREGAVVVHI
ncbi:MAG: ATP-binding protein, partial [Ardenticatenales bacterium]|nr:ATP-binding protein [Ardenticatenales bacterium]